MAVNGHEKLDETFCRLRRWESSRSSEALIRAARAPLRRPASDVVRWLDVLDALPMRASTTLVLDRDAPIFGAASELSTDERQRLERGVSALKPWRKGPFDLFGWVVDAEWRCSLKWDRLARYLDLKGARVLDVGAGNGYYCLRTLGAGARGVVGIDPSLAFVVQFAAVTRSAPDLRATVLPLRLEQLPTEAEPYDVVFSMGVLYHQREPLRHLMRLREMLVQDGRVVLETLVEPSQGETQLVPEERYAGMRNVWCIPSVKQTEVWLREAGFDGVQLLDVTATTTAEQRVTAFSGPRSLEHRLDPSDATRTIEGHPAPTRAMFLARRR